MGEGVGGCSRASMRVVRGPLTLPCHQPSPIAPLSNAQEDFVDTNLQTLIGGDDRQRPRERSTGDGGSDSPSLDEDESCCAVLFRDQWPCLQRVASMAGHGREVTGSPCMRPARACLQVHTATLSAAEYNNMHATLPGFCCWANPLVHQQQHREQVTTSIPLLHGPSRTYGSLPFGWPAPSIPFVLGSHCTFSVGGITSVESTRARPRRLKWAVMEDIACAQHHATGSLAPLKHST